MLDIRENLQKIHARIKRACHRVDRDPAGVTLIGVTKMVNPDRIRAGVEAGITRLGENYVQEARKKMAELNDLEICWDFIGHLQTNKAKQAVECFSWIHTVDRLKLARELNKRAGKIGKQLNVLIQVRLGDEETKSGIPPDQVWELYKEMETMDALYVRGLMAIPPYFEDPEKVRPYFQQLKKLLDSIRTRIHNPETFAELSMGMSHDFEVAIEEGATLIRVGTALFGRRV